MNKKILPVSVILWAVLIGIGEILLLDYAKTPGVPAWASAVWPSQAIVTRNPNQMTLVMFVHPHCPCTRASMEELSGLMAHCREKLEANVIFLKPAKFSEDWTKTDLWKTAGSIPGVQTMIDSNGAEAKRFGAMTSGQTFLYDQKGRLLFSGGITASRGHSGDNAGVSAIESLVLNGRADQNQTAVFGCPLSDHPMQWMKLISLLLRKEGIHARNHPRTDSRALSETPAASF